MSGVTIRPARPEDAGAILAMLRRLAQELGFADRFASDEAAVRRYGFGAEACFSAVLAEADGASCGMALFLRHFSTTRGMPGIYVQDLWIAPEVRGQRLGERLLARVARDGAEQWGAGYLALGVHRDNPEATRFYARLGFAADPNDQPMALDGAAFRELAEAG